LLSLIALFFCGVFSDSGFSPSLFNHAAGPLAVRRLERVNAAHSQSSGEAVSLTTAVYDKSQAVS
jgi:hypothetical protein